MCYAYTYAVGAYTSGNDMSNCMVYALRRKFWQAAQTAHPPWVRVGLKDNDLRRPARTLNGFGGFALCAIYFRCGGIWTRRGRRKQRCDAMTDRHNPEIRDIALDLFL